MKNMDVVPQSRIDLFAEMESHYEKQDTEYFVKLLEHEDYVVRCRATCIIVDLGGEDKVQYVAKVLKDDPNELVRHEAAFSLGQMCFSSGIAPLEDATANDPSMFVRHEAAVALGVVGSKGGSNVLENALNDPEESVRHSAVVALSNLEFMKTLSKNEKFAKLTGG